MNSHTRIDCSIGRSYDSNYGHVYIMDKDSQILANKTGEVLMSSIIEAFRSQDQEKRTVARRSALETCLDILRAIKEGSSTSTTIMYNANVSWEAMQNNLKILVLAGLVFEFGNKNRKKYMVTEKGGRLVASYQEIIGSITSFITQKTQDDPVPMLRS